MTTRLEVRRGDVSLAVTDFGGEGTPLVLLHGLAGSSREMLPTADALTDSFRVLLVDQRGHGRSTRRPTDVSREAYAADVVHVLESLVPRRPCVLVGQSMGAHTAFLVAASRPELVDRLVMLEGHVAGDTDPESAAGLGRFFASWPSTFRDASHAREFLGGEAIADAWVEDLESTPDGLRPRFDADIMERTIRAVHAPRWQEWEQLAVPTLAVFARGGMFTAAAKDELLMRRPATRRIDLQGGSHDAHLDAFDEWIRVLRAWSISAA